MVMMCCHDAFSRSVSRSIDTGNLIPYTSAHKKGLYPGL